MAFYETVFVARQDIAAAQVEAMGNNFADIVQKNGGKIVNREYWGLRNLAYRINKNRKGHYTLLNIEAPPAAIIELDRQIRLNEDILRHLTVRVEALEEGPSAMMQARSREDGAPMDDAGDDEGFGFPSA